MDVEEEADVKMILPCVGSKLREGSGLLTPEPSGRNNERAWLGDESAISTVTPDYSGNNTFFTEYFVQ